MSEAKSGPDAPGTKPVRVKICGLGLPDDARAAVASGADAIGLIFAESRRRVSSEYAKAIADAARDEAARAGCEIDVFGVFVNEAPARIAEIARDVPLDLIQLHGDETHEIARDLAGLRLVKAVRVRGRESLAEIRRLWASGEFESMLLDTFSEDARGGTGKTHDWGVAAEAARECAVILSGGLTPDNVREAVRKARPPMVDASSGVEGASGEKDCKLIARFICEAKAALQAPRS